MWWMTRWMGLDLLLHAVPDDEDAFATREKKLLVLWNELHKEERERGRAVRADELGRFKTHYRAGKESTFDAKTTATLWGHLAQAAEDRRWKALHYGDAPVCLEAEVTLPAHKDLQDVPKGEVESFEDGWHKWRGYWKQAWSFDAAYKLLNAEWHETQLQRAYAKKMERQRKQELQSMEADDARYGRGSPATLTHPRYKKEF